MRGESTRLLKLVSGAARLQKPNKIVFVASQEGKESSHLQGGTDPESLLRQLLNNYHMVRNLY